MRIKIQAVSGELTAHRLPKKYRKVLKHYALQEKHGNYLSGISDPDMNWDSSIEINSLQDLFDLKKQLGKQLFLQDDDIDEDMQEILIYDDCLD